MKVGRYARDPSRNVPTAGDRWRGWLESKVGEWVMFVTSRGESVMFLARDPDTGAVLSDRDAD